MNIVYRKIREDDVEGAIALEQASFADPWPRSAFAEIVDKSDADYYLAEDTDTGTLAGGCVVFRILDEGDITNVAVDERYRGQGIATQLLKYAIEQNEALGIEDFTLEVRQSNAAAIRVYEKCGFESAGVRPGFYDHPKEDGLIMWRYKEGR
ncbi:ribosomal-protein-alanine N-acetyltransferase [Lachnospiraceae bacterium XBB2008]|nr:ribosomal-protein-alanine N-acetyltransferase [Lachnospiraceae bacterium XBB2008]